VINLRKTIGILLLSSWLPFVLAMAFADAKGDSPWYLVTGFMWILFGTWAGILLVTGKK
jgi:hypothetical protein